MPDEDQLSVLSAASLVDVQSIDGGGTLAIRFRKPNEQELVILVPRQAAAALQAQVSEVLAQPRNPQRPDR